MKASHAGAPIGKIDGYLVFYIFFFGYMKAMTVIHLLCFNISNLFGSPSSNNRCVIGHVTGGGRGTDLHMARVVVIHVSAERCFLLARAGQEKKEAD